MNKIKKAAMFVAVAAISFAVGKAVDDKFRLSSKIRDVIPG